MFRKWSVAHTIVQAFEAHKRAQEAVERADMSVFIEQQQAETRKYRTALIDIVTAEGGCEMLKIAIEALE